MGKYNLHTHTFRCNHAVGDVSDMAEAARAEGYTTLGISEHTILNDDKWRDMRLTFSNVDEYFEAIKKQKEQEEASECGLRILAGLECEPLSEYFGFYKEIKDKYNVDYFIESNHFFPYEGGYICASGERFDVQKKIKAYAECSVKGMETGMFFCLGHPDMFMAEKERWDAYTADVMRDLIRASIQYKVPLEINLNGYRKGLVRRGLNLRYQYPVEEFWAIAASEGAEVIIGVDAHMPRNFAMSYPELNLMIKKYNFNILDEQTVLSRLKVEKCGREHG